MFFQMSKLQNVGIGVSELGSGNRGVRRGLTCSQTNCVSEPKQNFKFAKSASEFWRHNTILSAWEITSA